LWYLSAIFTHRFNVQQHHQLGDGDDQQSQAKAALTDVLGPAMR
jgi:hypothetical protein